MKLESKISKIPAKDSDIYNFLINFDNLKNLVPGDKVTDWQSNEDSCTFTVNPLGKTGIKLIEKEPYKLIKLTNLEETQYNFNFWVQLKPVDDNTTAIRLTIDAQLNPMISAMAKKPLKNFLDTLVDQLAKITYSTNEA